MQLIEQNVSNETEHENVEGNTCNASTSGVDLINQIFQLQNEHARLGLSPKFDEMNSKIVHLMRAHEKEKVGCLKIVKMLRIENIQINDKITHLGMENDQMIK